MNQPKTDNTQHNSDDTSIEKEVAQFQSDLQEMAGAFQSFVDAAKSGMSQNAEENKQASNQ